MPASGNENQQACERGLVCAPDTKRAPIGRGRSEILLGFQPGPSESHMVATPSTRLLREASERGKTFVFLYLKNKTRGGYCKRWVWGDSSARAPQPYGRHRGSLCLSLAPFLPPKPYFWIPEPSI